jgi:hypothetical protein
MVRVFLRTLTGLILLIAVGTANLWAGTKIWPTVLPFAIVATRFGAEIRSERGSVEFPEVKMCNGRSTMCLPAQQVS